MVITIPITKARINLGDVVRRAKLKKEYFILEKDGYPVAGLMGIDEFEDYLDANNLGMKKKIQRSYTEYKSGKSRSIDKLLNELKK